MNATSPPAGVSIVYFLLLQIAYIYDNIKLHSSNSNVFILTCAQTCVLM